MLRRAALAGLLASCAAVLALVLAVRLVPFDPAAIAPGEVSSIVTDRHGKSLRGYLSRDERWRIPAEIGTVSPWIVKATLAVEDQRFYKHGGVDFIAIGRAAALNLARGRVISGASTISMQSAGLADEPRRTFAKKLHQAFRSLQLERALTKNQILEFYLTHAPYGGNVCGIEAAALRYFNKTSAELSLSEAALLAGIPQSPTRLRPDRNLAATLKRRAHVLRRMKEEGMITAADFDRVISQRPAVGQFDAPVLAPHFSDLVHARHPHTPMVRTTLDMDVQRTAEKLIGAKVAQLRPEGVTNGAAVVIHNGTGEIRAMVGSVSYAASSDAGQVNGATAPRSPGSTLKPFLYGLAFHRRLAVPQTVLADVPQAFSEYRPDNFDHQFVGLVPAEKALAWSLNIPAIEMLQQVGVANAMHFLKRTGVATLQSSPGEYGLSLAIGTCSVRLVDLANAYAMLARGGTYKPWRVIPEAIKSGDSDGAPTQTNVRVFSEGTCYLVNRALADPALRSPEEIDEKLLGLEGISWKTGTSSGFRDAWTFGYNQQYTVGVWIGNMDGRASRALTGAHAAAPVALELMQWLGRGQNESSWPRKPADVATGAVCLETGLAPNADCPTTRSVAGLAKSGASAQVGPPLLDKLCQVHRRLSVDLATSTVLCTRCLAGHARQERVFAVWPTSFGSWRAQSGMNGSEQITPAPPRHFPGCETITPYSPPRITSPRPGERFLLTSALPAAYQKLALEAAAAPAGTKLYWFVGGALTAVSEAGGEPAFTELRPGLQSVRCVDELGRADAVTFAVDAESN